jgi:hypothetical protein
MSNWPLEIHYHLLLMSCCVTTSLSDSIFIINTSHVTNEVHNYETCTSSLYRPTLVCDVSEKKPVLLFIGTVH